MPSFDRDSVRPASGFPSGLPSCFALRDPGSIVSREIESRTPAAAKLTSSDDPPALMNGSVMPVTGSSATTTAMLMNAW